MKICPQCATRYELDQRFCSLDGSALVVEGSDQTDELIGRVIADRYAILRKIGEGGWGRVYLAEHVRMRRKSAVKIMKPWLIHDAEAVARFNREAANAAQINHPNVAAIYDFGEAERGLVYLSMEYVEGEPLSHLLHREGPLAPPRAAHITRQIADGLAAAHELGIVHRDLKPDNILIGKTRGGDDRVKLVDFGIAKAMNVEGQKVTRTGLMIGTPEYMSPEQLSGDPIDARSDIYSLGIVVFALLTNRLPFPAVTTKETLVARLTKPPFHLWEVMPEVEWPSALQAALNSALAPEPSERFAEVTQLARAVVEAVAPVPMAPVGLGAGGWDSSLSPPPTPLPSPQPSPPPAPIASPVAWAPPESTTPVPPAAPLPPPKPAITRKHLIIGGSMVGGSIMVSGLLWVLARPPGPVGEDSSRLVRTTDSIPAKPAKAETTSAVGPRGKTDIRRRTGSGIPEEPTRQTKTQAVVVEARPADLIARAREDLRKGRLFADEGQYVSADRWYDLARQRVDSVRERASDNAEAASLEREIAQRRADNRAACRTEQEIERRSNKKPRDCP